MGTKKVLMSPKEKKINGRSMLKLKFNSYFVNCAVATWVACRELVREEI